MLISENTFCLKYDLLLSTSLLFQDYNDEIRQEQMWEMHILNRSSSPNLSNQNHKNGDNSTGIIEKSSNQLLSNGVMLPVPAGSHCNVALSKGTNNNVLINNNNISNNYGTSSSNGSQTPPELPNSVSPTSMLMSHPAMRGLKTKAVGLSSPLLAGK